MLVNIFSDFGWILIDSQKFEHDVVIDYNGNIFERPKYLSSSKKSIYGHTPFTLNELMEIISRVGDFDTIIIGTGQYGAMPVEEDVKEYVKSINKELIITDTQKAINEFLNRVNKEKVIAIFHVTC